MCAQTEAEFSLEDLNEPAGSPFSGGVKDSNDKLGWDNSILEKNSAGSTLDGSTADDGKCIEVFNDVIITSDNLAANFVLGAPGDATTGEDSGLGSTYNFYGDFTGVEMNCLM